MLVNNYFEKSKIKNSSGEVDKKDIGIYNQHDNKIGGIDRGALGLI